MRNRNNEIKIRLYDDELNVLDERAKKCGLSREAYLRKLIVGVVPIEKPSVEWLSVIKNLRYLNNNINQIAVIANSTKTVNAEQYEADSLEIKNFIRELKQTFEGNKKFDYRKVVDDGDL